MGNEKDIESRLYELERIVKSAGLKLADDWGLFFMRCRKDDPLFADIQLAMVLLLHMTWQEAHGFSLEPKSMAEWLAPHGVELEEIIRILRKMEKVGLVGGERADLFKDQCYLDLSEFMKRIGGALGFEAEVEKRRKEVKAKKR